MVVATFLIAFARPCLLRHPQPRRNDALRLPIDFAMHTVSKSFISDRRNERNSKRARDGRDPAIHHASPCEGGIQEVMFILTLIRLDAATNSGLHAQVGSAGARLSSSAGHLGVARSAWGDRHCIFGGNGRRGAAARAARRAAARAGCWLPGLEHRCRGPTPQDRRTPRTVPCCELIAVSKLAAPAANPGGGASDAPSRPRLLCTRALTDARTRSPRLQSAASCLLRFRLLAEQ